MAEGQKNVDELFGLQGMNPDHAITCFAMGMMIGAAIEGARHDDTSLLPSAKAELAQQHLRTYLGKEIPGTNVEFTEEHLSALLDFHRKIAVMLLDLT